MSRRNTNISSITHSNSIPGRGQESPDLLSRCVEDQSLTIDYAETKNKSPANFTDIIIITDDDTESLDSDVTITLKPDIVVDYVQKPSPSKQVTVPIASCSTLGEHQQTQFIRCRSLKELLSNDTQPPKSQAKDHSKTQNDYKNLATSERIRERLELSPNVMKISNNSSSDSSSTIPPTPTPKRLKRRQRNVILGTSSNDDSDDLSHNTGRIQQHSKLKQIRSRTNVPTKSTNKFSNYCRVMAKWSMHETTPPTSESDSNDDDSKIKIIHKLPDKTVCKNRKPSNPSASQDCRRPTPKCTLDNNYLLKDSKNPITYSMKSTKCRDTKVEPKSPLNNKKNVIHDASISNILVDMDDRLKSKKVNDKVSSNADKEYEEVPHEIKYKDSYRKWMQEYPELEEKMMRHHNFAAGVKYLGWERLSMVWFLLKSKNISRSRSRKTWAKMMENGYLKHRSMRSLHNHFERKILPNIYDYNLPTDIVKEFEAIMH